MNATLLAVLTDSERLLVGQTEAAQLAALDEDEAVELQAHVRRARNKYSGLYRRGASARVPAEGGRGKARPMNTSAAMKAEAFEEALSRVSRRVATLARETAARLRTERVSAARAAKAGPGGKAGPSAKAGPAAKAGQAAGTKAKPGGPAAGKDTPGKGTPGPSAATRSVRERTMRTPATEKQRASTRATGARRQAKRDSR